MKQTKVKTTKVLSVVLVIILLMMSLLSINNFLSAEADTVSLDDNLCEEKIFTNSGIEDDFEDDSILVVIDKYNSGINKKQDALFYEIPLIKSIEDLTYISGDIESKEYLNKENFRQILKVSIKEKSKQNVLDTIDRIKEIDGILWAGVSGHSILAEAPAMSGSLYKSQWGLRYLNIGINAEGAWKYTQGSKSVRVGVIDTGIADHDDLRANVVAGWDFYNNNEITNDDISGHGTHVAGIIGATGANSNGVMGACPNVQLIPLQVHVKDRELSRAAIVSAITWAINNNIEILNYSIGDYYDDIEIRTVIENYQGLFVCCAGNDSLDTDVTPHYPSYYAGHAIIGERIISVGAINILGDITSFSNYGRNSVSLFAPGQDIWSTYPTSLEASGYKKKYGTSMAAPFVTGVAALLYSRYVDSYGLEDKEIAVQVKNAILDNVTKDSKYTDKCITGGRLNAEAALRNMPHRCAAEDFGLQDGNYKWLGKLDVNTGGSGYEIDSNEILVVKWYIGLQFSVGTKSVYNAWNAIESSIDFELRNSAGELIPIEGNANFNCKVNVGLVSNVTYTNRSFYIDTSDMANDTYTLYLTCNSTRKNVTRQTYDSFTFIVDHEPTGCVADGTLITLADGRQVAVETLTGEELLLVWNMFTGQFDVAPILFIDKEIEREYEVINLYFSDGTCVKVIDEHGFWDFDLNRYVFLRSDASRYIGHWFNKQTVDGDGNLAYTKVQLTDVVVQKEYTSAWSPVTYGHLCYYVNGMLSMPGATTGLINIFDVDPDTMKIDEAAYNADIQKYGTFTYEEFAQIADVPESVFEAFGGKYLKVAIGKGLISVQELEELIGRYSVFWENENLT